MAVYLLFRIGLYLLMYSAAIEACINANPVWFSVIDADIRLLLSR